MKKHENSSSNIDGMLRKLKQKGIKNVSLLSIPKEKTVDTLFYVDDSILKVKTLVKMDGRLEIFIEKSGEI